MTLKKIKNDNEFMRFVMSKGEFRSFKASDFKVGDKVLSIKLNGGIEFEDSNGHSIYVNEEMARNSRDEKILEVVHINKKIYESGKETLDLSNGWTYLPEMIGKKLSDD